MLKMCLRPRLRPGPRLGNTDA